MDKYEHSCGFFKKLYIIAKKAQQNVKGSENKVQAHGGRDPVNEKKPKTPDPRPFFSPPNSERRQKNKFK